MLCGECKTYFYLHMTAIETLYSIFFYISLINILRIFSTSPQFSTKKKYIEICFIIAFFYHLWLFKSKSKKKLIFRHYESIYRLRYFSLRCGACLDVKLNWTTNKKKARLQERKPGSLVLFWQLNITHMDTQLKKKKKLFDAHQRQGNYKNGALKIEPHMVKTFIHLNTPLRNDIWRVSTLAALNSIENYYFCCFRLYSEK